MDKLVPDWFWLPQVGDKVMCIDAGDGLGSDKRLVYGEIYTIDELLATHIDYKNTKYKGIPIKRGELYFTINGQNYSWRRFMRTD